MKQFTSSSKTIEACSTAEVTVTISVPSGYKFLDVCNVSSNGGVCTGYFGWRNGNTLHLYVSNVYSNASQTVTFTADVLFIKS